MNKNLSMPSLDHLGFDEVISLFDKKAQLTKEGNLLGLVELKKQYPDLFIKENEDEILELHNMVQCITNSDHFKQKLYEDKKKNLIDVDYQLWRSGMLDEILSHTEEIKIPQIHTLSRTLVKESIAIAINIFQHYSEDSSINNVFPFIGLLITEIITNSEVDSKEKLLRSALFKLDGNEEPSYDEHIFLSWKNKINYYLNIREEMHIRINLLFKSMRDKFDQRQGFNSDLFFFCTLEVSEFIGLLAANIGCEDNETKDIVIQKLKGNILALKDQR